jgi:hypothetical protein
MTWPRGRPLSPTLLLALLAAAPGCSHRTYVPTLHEPSAPPLHDPKADRRLKVHLASGELVVLESWKVDAERSVVEGEGQRLTALRQPSGPPGRQSVRLSEVALLETNPPRELVSRGRSRSAS